MRLSELKTGESATILKVTGHGGFRRRIMEMGFVRGQRVEVILNAPLKDPIEYKIMGYDISLRRSEADMVVVLSDSEASEYLAGGGSHHHHHEHHRRHDLAFQRHFGRSRTRRQLQRRDGRRQDRAPLLPRLPFRSDRPAGHLRPFGLHARRALRAQPHRREDSRRDYQLGGGVEPRTQPVPDHGADRHKPAHGRGAQHVRRA